MSNKLSAALFSCLFALASAALPCAATSQTFSDRYNNCAARAHGTVQEGVCAEAELGRQDDRLNKAYQQLMAQSTGDPAKKLALRDEERAWLKKRDYDCKINGDTIDDSCLMRKTAQRADELESKLKF